MKKQQGKNHGGHIRGRSPLEDADKLLLAHGGGGSLTRELIDEVFIPCFSNPSLDPLGDSALVSVGTGALAMTTDAYVVDPRFFPGGDIGALAVAGTVNDLAAGGAIARYLTCSFILEEGLPIAELRSVSESMRDVAAEAGVQLVAGDTKVVPKGHADGMFISTTGIGELRELPADWGRPQPGDRVLVSGAVGDHGFAVLAAREALGFAGSIRSDCAPLGGLVAALFESGAALRFLRDPTRGGLAAVLNELVRGQEWGLVLSEADIPVSREARALGEILGLDPLQSASEGRMVVVCSAESAPNALAAMRSHPYGGTAAAIGTIEAAACGRVVVETPIGGRRILDMPLGEELPRIC